MQHTLAPSTAAAHAGQSHGKLTNQCHSRQPITNTIGTLALRKGGIEKKRHRRFASAKPAMSPFLSSFFSLENGTLYLCLYAFQNCHHFRSGIFGRLGTHMEYPCDLSNSHSEMIQFTGAGFLDAESIMADCHRGTVHSGGSPFKKTSMYFALSN
jgi:hypothetical protein